MLGEADRIPDLIRFVPKIISAFLAWIRRLRKESPLGRRSRVEYREFQWGGLSYKSYTFEQSGPPIEDAAADRVIEQAQSKRLSMHEGSERDEQVARPT